MVDLRRCRPERLDRAVDRVVEVEHPLIACLRVRAGDQCPLDERLAVRRRSLLAGDRSGGGEVRERRELEQRERPAYGPGRNGEHGPPVRDLRREDQAGGADEGRVEPPGRPLRDLDPPLREHGARERVHRLPGPGRDPGGADLPVQAEPIGRRLQQMLGDRRAAEVPGTDHEHVERSPGRVARDVHNDLRNRRQDLAGKLSQDHVLHRYGRRVYLSFPPGQGHVLVPLAKPGAAALGMTLYTASRALPLRAQQGLWVAARLGAVRVLPGARLGWEPPFGPEELAALVEQWRQATGRPFEAIAVYNRPQEHRESGLILLCGEKPMVVRFRRDPTELALERAISTQAEELAPVSFRVPRLLGEGRAGEWHWTGYEVMSRAPHRPARACPDGLAEEVTALVEATVPRALGTPTGWCGSHGDLTPWNLRAGGGALWLIDWEDAGYAPRGADEVYFAVSRAGFRRTAARAARAIVARYPEAARYWAARVAERPVARRDANLTARMQKLLFS